MVRVVMIEQVSLGEWNEKSMKKNDAPLKLCITALYKCEPPPQQGEVAL